jgi:hypothetical protein
LSKSDWNMGSSPLAETVQLERLKQGILDTNNHLI